MTACLVCASVARDECGYCRNAAYCSRHCQRQHRSDGHLRHCVRISNDDIDKTPVGTLLWLTRQEIEQRFTERTLVDILAIRRVVDGDTLVISTPASAGARVRFDGVDAPEKRQEDGPDAKAALEAWVAAAIDAAPTREAAVLFLGKPHEAADNRLLVDKTYVQHLH